MIEDAPAPVKELLEQYDASKKTADATLEILRSWQKGLEAELAMIKERLGEKTRGRPKKAEKAK